MRELAPELMHADKQIYDLPQHTVTVTEINSIDLMNAGGAYLGMNTVCHCSGYFNEVPVLHAGEDSGFAKGQTVMSAKCKPIMRVWGGDPAGSSSSNFTNLFTKISLPVVLNFVLVMLHLKL